MVTGLVRLVRGRIAVKLTLTLVTFVAIALLAAGLYLDRALEGLAVQTLETRLAALARVVHDEARQILDRGGDPAALRAFAMRVAQAGGARVTVVSPEGRVIGDSEVAPADLGRVESHASRPEVRAALEGRQGHDLHRSSVVGAPSVYVAIPIADGGRVIGVLRLAEPLSSVTTAHAAVQRTLLAGAVVAVLVALAIGLFVAGRVARPVVVMQAVAHRMSEGNFGVRAPVRSPDEIGVLGRSLNALAARLQEKLDAVGQEQAKVSAILDGMVEGVVAVDARDHIALLNEPTRGLFTLPAGRSEGRPFLEVIRNADLHAILRASRAGGEGVVTRRELTLTTPQERVLQVNAVPLRITAAEVGVVMVLHDVTELRRLERVRTEFVANVSHELRTPLTAIHGYLETLLGGALEEPEHARPFLEVVFRHTERLGRLLDDLTDLSNIELGRVTLRREALHLREVVDPVLAIVHRRAGSGGVTLLTELADDLPAVEADRDRLEQILLNLVDNAVKYTPAGGQVTIGARPVAGEAVEVWVADTGVGIPATDLPRVTERFYRVDKARSRELGGTGLGLAIVKHLVIAHGGDLAIQSEPGRGTTVRFTLPTSPAGEGTG